MNVDLESTWRKQSWRKKGATDIESKVVEHIVWNNHIISNEIVGLVVESLEIYIAPKDTLLNRE